MKILDKIIGLFLLTTPFLIGWAIFILLAPSSFWQIFATLIFTLLVCIPEGFFAWIIGLIILDSG